GIKVRPILRPADMTSPGRVAVGHHHAPARTWLLASGYDFAARQCQGRTGVPGLGAPGDLEPRWQPAGEHRLDGQPTAWLHHPHPGGPGPSRGSLASAALDP